MATASGTEPGKGTFVREFFANNHDANEQSVNEAWASEGREGTISVSLISKIKAELGLTNRGKGAGRPKSDPAAKVKGRGKGRKPSKKGGGASHAPAALRATQRTPQAAPIGSDMMDELEGDLDDLIQKIKEAGEMLDVVKLLRRARRIIVRSHEG